jgi:hypothetical protein
MCTGKNLLVAVTLKDMYSRLNKLLSFKLELFDTYSKTSASNGQAKL